MKWKRETFMPDNDFLHQLLHGLPFQLPYLVVYLAGIILAIVLWRRYPLPSLLVVLACVIKIGAAMGYVLFAALILPGGDFDLHDMLMHVVSFVDAGAYGLLLAAAFTSRRPPEALPRTWPNEPEPTNPESRLPQAASEPSDCVQYRERK